MKNLFDQQLNETFNENLESIHASDELKAKLMKRLSQEGPSKSNRTTTLTAIAPDFVLKNHTPKSKRLTLIVSTLVAASLLLISSVATAFWTKTNKAEPSVEVETVVTTLDVNNIQDDVTLCDSEQDNKPISRRSSDLPKNLVPRSEQLKSQANTFSYNSRAHRV